MKGLLNVRGLMTEFGKRTGLGGGRMGVVMTGNELQLWHSLRQRSFREVADLSPEKYPPDIDVAAELTPAEYQAWMQRIEQTTDWRRAVAATN